MKKKIWFVSIGCLIAGFAIGYFCALVHEGGIIADSLALLKEIEITESGKRAFQAYQHESKTVAIYALTQDLNILQDDEKLGKNPYFATPTEIQRRLMFDHARLAKLLAETGQADVSTNHIVEALKYAQETSDDPNKIARLSYITNDAQLFEIVAKFDQKGVP
jgi:hypothetical protein